MLNVEGEKHTAASSHEEEASLNPRFVLWARAYGHDPDALIRRDRSEDMPRVLDEEDPKRRTLPWTIVFMLWIQSRWSEWGRELGFEGDYFRRPHEQAQFAGHTGFDAWLERWVETKLGGL